MRRQGQPRPPPSELCLFATGLFSALSDELVHQRSLRFFRSKCTPESTGKLGCRRHTNASVRLHREDQTISTFQIEPLAKFCRQYEPAPVSKPDREAVLHWHIQWYHSPASSHIE